MARPDSTPILESAAMRFAAVSEFVGGLGEPGRVSELVEVLNRGDAGRFEEMTSGYGDFPSRCSLMCHVAIEVISTGSPPEIVEQCFLRADLTWRESFKAFQIYRKHFGFPGRPVTQDTNTSAGVVVLEIIPPGPYLDELKANGLVTCRTVRTPGSGVITGAREFVCLAVCPP